MRLVVALKIQVLFFNNYGVINFNSFVLVLKLDDEDCQDSVQCPENAECTGGIFGNKCVCKTYFVEQGLLRKTCIPGKEH
jgi:hypothetical protein